VIKLAISPQLRQYDPDRPLSLLEALDTAHAADGHPAVEPEPEAEP
jgi:hypothetical protein